ncbi:MAG: PaaI family thioesterase [Dehalococcoidales bacterium]|nr:PaaI family thioesterase [Dehalococcoidales bacterium]
MSNWPQVELNLKPGYGGCFGCGENNVIGFKLKFQRDAQGTSAAFTGSEKYQGWPGYLHGGIVGCLLDEIMSNTASYGGIRCVTAKYDVRLKKLIPIDEPLTLTARVVRKTRKVIECASEIKLKDGTVVAEGSATHFVVDTTARADNKAGNP